MIKHFGGAEGVRDKKGYDAAIHRPFQTFGGKELHPTILHKAAAIFESILINHPFVDGNKRTAYTLLRLFLLSQKRDIQATEEEKYLFVIATASGKMKIESIVEWLSKKVIAI